MIGSDERVLTASQRVSQWFHQLECVLQVDHLGCKREGGEKGGRREGGR